MIFLNSVKKYTDCTLVSVAKLSDLNSDNCSLGFEYINYDLKEFRKKMDSLEERKDFKFDDNLNGHLFGTSTVINFDHKNTAVTKDENLCLYDNSNIFELLNLLSMNRALLVPEEYLESSSVEPCSLPSFTNLVISDSTMSISLSYVNKDNCWRSYKIIDDCGDRKIEKTEFYFAINSRSELDLSRFSYISFIKEITNNLGSYKVYLCSSDFSTTAYMNNIFRIPLTVVGKIKDLQYLHKCVIKTLEMCYKSLSDGFTNKYKSESRSNRNRQRFYVNIDYDGVKLSGDELRDISDRVFRVLPDITKDSSIIEELRKVKDLGYSNLYCKVFYSTLSSVVYSSLEGNVEELFKSITDYKIAKNYYSLVLYSIRLFYFFRATKNDLVSFNLNPSNWYKCAHISFCIGGV